MMEPRYITSGAVGPSRHSSQRQKTFTGCWDCRSRKVKCDEGTPECTPCRRRGFPCSGYQPVLVWITPHRKNYEAGKRRVLKSYLTWRGRQIYDSSSIDALIAQCDNLNPNDGSCEKFESPFNVFASAQEIVPAPHAPPSGMHQILDDENNRQLRDNAGHLFHHYSTFVALNMMPFGDQRNPWQSCYPLMARCGRSCGHRALLHAMLAQAAGNLAQMGCKKEKMSKLSTEHYALAIQHLRRGLEDDSKDFSLVLAGVLTLIMAEVYNGKSRCWRLHLSGAWGFIGLYQSSAPWLKSEEAWLTAQSLCLLKIRCDTMQKHTSSSFKWILPDLDAQNYLLSSVRTRADFGFTVGASPALISYIIETTRLSFKVLSDGLEAHHDAINMLYQQLQGSDRQDRCGKNLVLLHHQIFELGAIIYFHRSIHNSPPQTLKAYLEELLQHLKRYRDLGGGYVTLWPVFIAAVEAYQEDHKVGFREWLDDNDKMGAASRGDIRKVIEAVWEKRTSLGQQICHRVDQGEIVVDWKEVMYERGLDILLV